MRLAYQLAYRQVLPGRHTLVYVPARDPVLLSLNQLHCTKALGARTYQVT